MANTASDITAQLADRFAQMLPPGADRRIVIWHDQDSEFETNFDLIASDDALGAASERPLRYVKVEEGKLFTTKLLINREDTTSDLLLYRKRSAGDLARDWLADVELYSESFQADFISMLVDELGALDTNDVRSALARYKGFFAAKDRKKSFVALVPHASKSAEVVIGVLAAVMGAASLRSEEIVRTYALALRAQGRDSESSDAASSSGGASSVFDQLKRFGLEDALAHYLNRVTGYEGDLFSYDAFMDHLLFSAFAETVPAEEMKGLEGKYSLSCSMFCLNIVHDWLEADSSKREVLFEATRACETRNNLGLRFNEAKTEALLNSDIFPQIDVVLLKRFMGAIVQGRDCRSEIVNLQAIRRDFPWASQMREFYDLLDIASSMRDFYLAYADGFHASSAKGAFDSYTSDWWRMDYLYRKFCEAAQRCVAFDNEALIESMQELREWGNNLYSNWFLVGVNECWIAAAAHEWETSGYVQGVPLQRRFFADEVQPQLSKVKRIAIIISDAFRYAVGCELKEQLDRKTRNSVSISAMQATFPSITSFGMAALLPHSVMNYESDGSVLVDGMKTSSTELRQKVLDKAKPGSLAIRADKLFSLTVQERKELVKDAPVTYIYHNTIDAAGEEVATESKVFGACEQAVQDLFDLTKILVGSMGYSRVIITADHGFLYTENALPESERISSLEVGNDNWMLAERFAIVSESPSSNLFTTINMNLVSNEDVVGLAPRGFAFIKRPGGGRYAHGGVSLQEVCVPVLHVKNTRAKSDETNYAQDAELQLLDTNRRITSMIFTVRLYQPEALSGKIAPCRYEFEFVDKAGNVISDIRHATADRESAEPSDRQYEVRFSLKEGIAYSSSEPYYLVARKEETGEQAWREQFNINIAFAPLEDFGF